MSATQNELSKYASNKWVILTLLALAQFMVVLDIAIVNVALPSINNELHFAPGGLQWVITAYTLTFGGFLLFGGRAADLFGRRRLFIGSVAGFALASLFCGLAQNDTTLIITRAVQGIGAAILSPVALSIVLSEFTEGEERNKAMGVWAAVASGGAAAGVLIGGVVTQYLNWRWNFFVNVPVGIVVILAAWRLLPHHIGEEGKKIDLDLGGTVLATAGLMSMVYGLSKAPTLGWGSHIVWEFILAALALLIIFVWNEQRIKEPLMPLSLFRIRNVSGGNLAFLVIACTLFSMFFFLTLYLQTVLAYSPVKAGLSFLPITLVVGIVSGVVSNIVGKIGYKPPLALGPLALAAGLYLLSVSLEVGGNYWYDVLPGMSIFAMGMGLTFVSGTLAATAGVPKHLSGLASGVLNTSQQIGGALGLAILSAVAFTTIKNDLIHQTAPLAAQVHGYRSGLQVGVGLALFAVLVVLLVVKNEQVDAKEALTKVGT